MKQQLFRSQQGLAPLVIVIIVAVVALAGAGAYYAMRGTGSAASTDSTATGSASGTSEETSLETTGEMKTDLMSLVSKGQNLECTWRMPVAEGEETPFGEGKLWTTGNKGRSTITGNPAGMQMEGNAIYTQETIYSWISSDMFKMGFKFTPETIKELNDGMSAEERQQAEQIRKEMIVNCKSWTPDESKFVVPTDVEFKEQ